MHMRPTRSEFLALKSGSSYGRQSAVTVHHQPNEQSRKETEAKRARSGIEGNRSDGRDSNDIREMIQVTGKL